MFKRKSSTASTQTFFCLRYQHNARSTTPSRPFLAEWSLACDICASDGCLRRPHPHIVMSAIDTQTYRRLSLSLNDLDHILKKRGIIRLESQQSSSEASFDSSWCPAHPLEPIHPPPARINTPPGLPPFGSRQATLLRLEQRPSSKRSLRLRNLLHSVEENNEHALASGSVSPTSSLASSPFYSPPLSPQNPPNGPSDRRDLLGRTLAAIGMSRMLEPDPVDCAASSILQNSPLQASTSISKINLPPGV